MKRLRLDCVACHWIDSGSFSIAFDKSKLAAKDKIADENNIIQAQTGVAFISIMTVLTGPSLLIINLVWRSYFVN